MKKTNAPDKGFSLLWPFAHGRFQEMCALAVTGQLGGPQMTELNEHIGECSPCREYLESLAQATAQTMPLLAEKHEQETTIQPPVGMRGRFLARLEAEAENGKAHVQPRRPQPELVLPLDPAPSRPRLVTSKSSVGSFSLVWRSAIAVAACALIAFAGYNAGIRKNRPAVSTSNASPVAAQPDGDKPISSTEELDRVGELQRQKTQLESELGQVREELSASEAERTSLRDELAAAKGKLTEASAQRDAIAARASEQNVSAKDEITTLQGNVDRLSQRLNESDVKLGIQKETNDDLTGKLALTEDNLQKEEDLKSAEIQMGQLAGARNLHIVDVYDADASGKRQRAFGRVFYIEGQSLVLYAYDLNAPGEFKQNVVFHVWGGRAGVSDVTHSLGILHKDDSTQSRWAMTFDDPKVLTQINSVFVTAESASKPLDQPRGRKLLYAYFGSQPNHP